MKLASLIKRLGRRITNGTLAVLFLLFSANLVPLSTAFADPVGNNGTLQVHEQSSPDYKKDNEPHVCTFNFEAFDLDANQTGQVHITNQAPTQPKDTEVLTLNLATDANGNGNTLYVNDATQTPAYSLPNGHYKATLDDKFGTDPGNKAKSKVFWVTCGVTPVQPTIETQVSSNTVIVGSPITDLATVTGTDTNGTVDGMIDFYVCGPDASAPDCSTGGTLVSSAVALTDADTDPPSSTASSTGFTPQTPGIYCFRAEFTPSSDNSSYLATTHTNQTSECFTADPMPVYGSITIKKNAIPDSSQAFHFTTTGLSTDATGFDLVDDSTAGLPQQVFSNLGAGTYTVSETATAGWDFGNITCDNDGAAVTTTGSTVSIALSGDQNVVCTYTNRERGTITVNKVTIPANDPTGFPISLATTTAGATVTENPSQTLTTSTPVVYHVSQGTYNVTEDLSNLPNWQTTNNGCSSVTVNSSNLNATCTITNTKYTSLTGTKWEVNADGSTVGTTGLAGWQINLYKNGTATGQTATTGSNGSYSFTNLVDDGTYTVQEVNQSGWTPICSAYLQNICGNNPYDFGNFKNASISGYKWNDLNQDGKHQTTEPKLAGWTIFIDANGNGKLDSGEVSTVTDSNGNYSFDNLAPGKYRLCEVQQAGWVQTYPGTKSGCSSVTVKTSGKTYHRDFGNYQPQQQTPTATITIVKDAQPNSSQAFSFTTNANQSGGFSLTDDGTGTADSITFANLPLRDGAYTFSENEVAGWTLTDVKCTGGDWGLDGQLYVYPGAGDDITCTFTNVAQPATVTVVKKAYPVSPLSFGFTTDLSGASQNFSLTDNGTDASLASRTFTKVAPGTYTISETELDGWALLSADCGQGVATSLKGTELTLTVAPGATLTCTFTNQEQGGHILGASTTTGSAPQLVNTGKNLLAVTLAGLTIVGTALAVAVSRKQQKTTL